MHLLEIFSDIICPWCFIGKKRLDVALQKFDSHDVQILWQPFQLNPEMPQEGMKRLDYRLKKFGSIEYSNRLDSQVKQTGLSCGIEFSFNDKTPNTFNAHKLLQYASKKNQNDVMESLFEAYFCLNKDIGDLSVLVEIGVKHGMDQNYLKDFFESETADESLKKHLKRGQDLNINGVPAFVINNRLVFSGAQDPDTIARTLQESFSI